MKCMSPQCANRKAEVTTDRWALGRCVLMQVADPANPSLVEGPAGGMMKSLQFSKAKHGSMQSSTLCRNKY